MFYKIIKILLQSEIKVVQRVSLVVYWLFQKISYLKSIIYFIC